MIDLDSAKVECEDDRKNMQLIATASVWMDGKLYYGRYKMSYRGLASDEYDVGHVMRMAVANCIDGIIDPLRDRLHECVQRALE